MSFRKVVIAGSCTGLLILSIFANRTLAETKMPEKPSFASDEAKENYKRYLKKAELHLKKFEFQESIKYCELALQYYPCDYLARAVICFNYYEIAEQLSVRKAEEKKLKIEIYEKMLKLANEGINYAPDRGECYFMRGLADARLSTTRGILYSLFSINRIEKDWLKAVEYKSEYRTPDGSDLLSSSYVALGVFYRLCPSFFMFEIAFGVKGDIDKSADYCRKAYELDPTRIDIVKEYGISLISRGLQTKNEQDIEKGKEYLKMVPHLPRRYNTDVIDIEHSSLLVENISLCLGYSRDQQQEVSQKNYSEFRK